MLNSNFRKFTMKASQSGLLKIMYWIPRVISILAILFISAFALDSFAPGRTPWQQIGDFLMHLIPSFVLAILLLYTWKHEKWGGILFILIGAIFTPLVFTQNYRMNHSVGMSLGIISLITIPFIVVGILFIVHYVIGQKKSE